jgi:hypothetical protein
MTITNLSRIVSIGAYVLVLMAPASANSQQDCLRGDPTIDNHTVSGNIDDFEKDMTAGFWKPQGTPPGDIGGVTSEEFPISHSKSITRRYSKAVQKRVVGQWCPCNKTFYPGLTCNDACTAAGTENGRNLLSCFAGFCNPTYGDTTIEVECLKLVEIPEMHMDLSCSIIVEQWKPEPPLNPTTQNACKIAYGQFETSVRRHELGHVADARRQVNGWNVRAKSLNHPDIDVCADDDNSSDLDSKMEKAVSNYIDGLTTAAGDQADKDSKAFDLNPKNRIVFDDSECPHLKIQTGPLPYNTNRPKE